MSKFDDDEGKKLGGQRKPIKVGSSVVTHLRVHEKYVLAVQTRKHGPSFTMWWPQVKKRATELGKLIDDNLAESSVGWYHQGLGAEVVAFKLCERLDDLKDPPPAQPTVAVGFIGGSDGVTILGSRAGSSIVVKPDDAYRLIMACLVADPRWEMLPSDWRNYFTRKKD